MKSNAVLVTLAVIGGLTLFASISRTFWFALMTGGPMFLGVVLICVFLLGVFLGGR